MFECFSREGLLDHFIGSVDSLSNVLADPLLGASGPPHSQLLLDLLVQIRGGGQEALGAGQLLGTAQLHQVVVAVPPLNGVPVRYQLSALAGLLHVIEIIFRNRTNSHF